MLALRWLAAAAALASAGSASASAALNLDPGLQHGLQALDGMLDGAGISTGTNVGAGTSTRGGAGGDQRAGGAVGVFLTTVDQSALFAPQPPLALGPPPAAPTIKVSRRRDCHSAASPSTFSRCFNRDEKGVSSK